MQTLSTGLLSTGNVTALHFTGAHAAVSTFTRHALQVGMECNGVLRQQRFAGVWLQHR